MEGFRRHSQRRRQGEKNNVCHILSRIECELTHTTDYHNYKFYRVDRAYSDEKRTIFRKVTRQVLKRAERLLDKILEMDPVTVNILMEANKLDMQVRWSINKAAILAFGHARDKSYVTFNKEGN